MNKALQPSRIAIGWRLTGLTKFCIWMSRCFARKQVRQTLNMTSNSPETELEQKLRQAETEKTGSYEKRTEHLDAEGNANFVNRLILEDSPYLLQHAHNPVNWWAWGAEAFEAARTEHKPIFLSIGYSTCHWCHVMEVESFDNVEIAKLLNNHFISIKIDREQFPDVDEIYMTGVQIISGQGGWPMSNFLLPDGKPFFAATYFPPPTFMKLLLQIVEAWQDKYPELEKSANDISDAINRILSVRNEAVTLDSKIPETVAQALFQREDRSLGGLVGAPKFPQEPLLLFMMDRVRRARDVNAMGFVCRALDAMACGGIYDQVAGGFHRYSVDEQWLVPHFEKMLYNQSQLGRVYLEAFRLTGNSFFSRICKQTLDYVLRDMQMPEGGFFSATDADSEGAEGVFFLWTIAELDEVLDKEEIELALSVFDITERGNFEKSNILNLSEPLSGQRSDRATDFIERLDIILEKLYSARERRIHPFRDDKLIVSWTGAMISTLAQAGFYYMNREWTDAAERATQMVYEHNVRRDGRLNRVYLNGATSIGGQLEDFANFIQALLILFSVTGKQQYLSQAVSLMDTTVQEFWDDKEGSFFLSPHDQAGPQLTRSRNASDGATISAIATTLDCLLRLLRCSALCDDTHNELYYRQYIDTCLASLTGQINENSMSHTSLLRVIDGYKSGCTDPIQYVGNGLAKIVTRKISCASEGKIAVEITAYLEDGWHITAAGLPTGSYVALKFKMAEKELCWEVHEVTYPSGTVSLMLNQDKVDIYENDFTVSAILVSTEKPGDVLSSSVSFELTLQLCDKNNCLLPETLQFVI